MDFLTNLNLNKNELQNAVVQNVVAAPAAANSKAGQIIFTDSALKFFDGEKWVNPCDNAPLSEVVPVTLGGTGLETIASGEVLVGNGTGNVQTLPIDTTVTDDSDNLVTSGAVYDAIAAGMGSIEKMVFKGTVAADGTITSADTDINGQTFTNLTAYKNGWTFKAAADIPTSVINIGGKNIEAGDMIIAIADRNASTGYAAADFSVIQTNIDGAVVGPSSVSTDTLCAFDGTTGKLIKASTVTASDIESLVASMYTLSNASGADVVLSSSNTTSTIVGQNDSLSATLSNTGVTAGTYGENTDTTITAGETIVVPKVVVDAKGRVTSAEDQTLTINIVGTVKKYTTTNPALTPTSGTVTWTVTHSLNTDVQVTVYDTTSGAQVFVDVVKTDSNTATITFNASAAVAVGAYTVVVVG